MWHHCHRSQLCPVSVSLATSWQTPHIRRKYTKFLRRIRRRRRLNGTFGFQLDRSGARKTRGDGSRLSASLTWSVPSRACQTVECRIPSAALCACGTRRLVFVKRARPPACVDVVKGLFCFFRRRRSESVYVYVPQTTWTAHTHHGRQLQLVWNSEFLQAHRFSAYYQ